MSILEIRCYHNGCPKRKFFNSLPIDHIFIYATLGHTNIMYEATGYCIFKEEYSVSDIEKKFIKIAGEASPIRIFLGEEEKPKYYESLNALAFRYEVEVENGEEREIILSFYQALRKKCRFAPENIVEIKVLRKDEDKTEEAAFLKSLDVKLIKKAIKELKSIDVKFIEEATKELKSINVYERIDSKDVTEEYEEEKTPKNKFKRISESGFLTFSQQEQAQDLLHFFAVFLPPPYSTESFRKKIEKIKSKDPKKLLEEEYERIKMELISIRTTINEDQRDDYLDTFALMEECHISYQGWLKKSRRTSSNVLTQSTLSNARRDFRRILLEAGDFLRELRKR